MSNYKDLPKVILAKDDITSAYQNQIPLYQFGFFVLRAMFHFVSLILHYI